MIADLTNHLWQSTLFAVAAALVAAALRQNRAAVRHAVWLTASVKFLLPFSLLMSLGSQLAPARAPEIVPPDPPAVSVAIDQLAQPFSGVFPDVTTATPTTTNWMPIVAAGIWMCGFMAIALTRLRDWQRVRAAVRASSPVAISGIAAGVTRDAQIQIRSAPGLLEPGVVGLWRPILLVPEDIVGHLTAPQLEGILAHEVWHIRRRDNLTAMLHMVVEAVFWFHPLVWWIGARLVDERERACDEYVLGALGEPQAYAQGILNVCKLYQESPIASVSGVSGSNLKKRLEAIMINRIGRNLNLVRKTGLACAATAAIAAPFVIGLVTAPLRASMQAQSPTASGHGTGKQRFEVVSVKPCQDEPSAPTGARMGGPGISNASPGRINIPCATVEALINTAYIRFGEQLLNDSGNGVGDYKRIAGGPGWTRSDKYAIEARAEGTPDAKVMMGPMLQALLEDRFQLRIHREVEERPMYAMTAAKAGLKIRPIGPDGCKPVDAAVRGSEDPLRHVAAMLAGEMPTCSSMTMATDAGLRKWIIGGTTMESFATTLSGAMDRRVVDKTGITEKFNIRLEFAPDEHTPGRVARPPVNPPDASGPSIFEALDQQLGLKLEPTKGPAGFLVIDRVERPTPDRAQADQNPSVPSQAALQTQGSQKFEVASIKPCEPQPVPPGGRSGGGSGSFSPGRAYLSCFVVRNLIDVAYVNQRTRTDRDDPLLNWPRLLAAGAPGEAQRIRGGPAWVYSDKYTIEAKANGLDPSQQQSADRALMLGPMLRTLLEDRFQLKLHQEIEEVPMFALKVASGGLKIKPMEPGGCTQDRSNGPILLSDAARRGVKPTCGTVNGGPNGPNWRYEHGGQTLAVVAAVLSGDLGIKVIDRTGVTDIFNITWEFGPDESTPGVARFFEMSGSAPAGPPTAPSVFRALQEQLGLTVERIKGPRGYIVIDHIEKPTPDQPASAEPSAGRSARARGAGRS
jgi:bla regulator protein blaR1